jgi:hypothetical protein
MPKRLPFTEKQARDAIRQARCWTEALRLLGYRNIGGNAQTLKKHAVRWGIATDHFNPRAVMLEALALGRRNRKGTPLKDVLVRDSTFSRGHLKERLFRERLKKRQCELCGQGETWRGCRISLILDHINGEGTDNRLENLRIVCPNCAATLDTLRKEPSARASLRRMSSKLCPSNDPTAVLLIPMLQRNPSARCREALSVFHLWDLATRPAQSRPPAIRAAPSRDSGDELPGCWPQVRRLGQCDPQMDPVLRARTGTAGARGDAVRRAGGRLTDQMLGLVGAWLTSALVLPALRFRR